MTYDKCDTCDNWDSNCWPPKDKPCPSYHCSACDKKKTNDNIAAVWFIIISFCVLAWAGIIYGFIKFAFRLL